MPLREVEFPSDPKDLEHAQEQFLIFYSSRVNGQLWCPVSASFTYSDNKLAVLTGLAARIAWQ
jgi:hypothetical protein